MLTSKEPLNHTPPKTRNTTYVATKGATKVVIQEPQEEPALYEQFYIYPLSWGLSVDIGQLFIGIYLQRIQQCY